MGAISEEYYKKYRNILNITIKIAKKTYYINLFTNFKHNTSKIRKAINQ